jgi:predicted naringenin-chalcone synthase
MERQGPDKITATGLTKVQIKEIEHFIADNSTHSRAERAIDRALTRHKTEERQEVDGDKAVKEPEFWVKENKLFIHNLSRVVTTYDKHSSDVP